MKLTRDPHTSMSVSCVVSDPFANASTFLVIHHSTCPSIVPVEQCRLPDIVLVKSLGIYGNSKQWKYAE